MTGSFLFMSFNTSYIYNTDMMGVTTGIYSFVSLVLLTKDQLLPEFFFIGTSKEENWLSLSRTLVTFKIIDEVV